MTETPQTAPEPDGTLGQFIGCSVLVLTLLAAIGGLIWLVVHLLSGGDELARLSLTRTAQEAPFALEEPATVEAWARVDIVHEGISPSTAHDSLPHVVDYLVEIRRGDELVVSQRCNPIDVGYVKTSGSYNSIGEPQGRYYDGRMRGCAVKLPAGRYSVRAWLDWFGRDERLLFRTTELILRAD